VAIDFGSGGTTNSVDCGDIDMVYSTVSLACWVYCRDFPNGVRDDRWISKALNTNEDAHVFMIGYSSDSNVVRARWNNSLNTQLGTTTLATSYENQWNHFAATYNNGTGELFLNGVSEGTDSGFNTGNLVNTTDQVILGNNTNASNLSPDAILADCCLWKAQLSAADCLELTQGKDPRTVRPDDLLHYWPMYFSGDGIKVVDIVGGGHGTGTAGTSQASLEAPTHQPWHAQTRRDVHSVNVRLR
jgi:hypothetical protein